jgi:rubrerythrin
MAFNPWKEKGVPLEKQIRNWNRIVQKPYDKHDIDPYTRTRQILINGIEMEAWSFKHSFARFSADEEVNKLIAQTRHAEDQQQTTINWLIPADQTVLETTIAYEQVATDLTAYLAQNEPDDYVRQVFDFGLLEDFDHLYRYCQMYDLLEGKDPTTILKGKTLVFPGRPTQDHHNEITLRLRKHYDRNTASPQTKVNILTLLAGEQQTHNFYKEHGMQYGNPVLRKLYAEIGDVEEEHVTQYESLIDPRETLLEKLVLHEFTEVCNYYTFVHQENDPKMMKIWEEFLSYELEHLRLAGELLKKYEDRDPEEITGSVIIEPSKFFPQKTYVEKVLREQIDLRLSDGKEKGFTKLNDLPEDWPSYKHQERINAEGAPSEMVISLASVMGGRDVIDADGDLEKDEINILERGFDKMKAPNTVNLEELEKLISAKKK